jgi:hypothetical protein
MVKNDYVLEILNLRRDSIAEIAWKTDCRTDKYPLQRIIEL